jgi:SET domain-containing protein
MLHPAFDLRHISEEEGLGVVATRFIPKGTMTSIETDLDLILTPAQMEQLDSAHQELIKKYGYRKPTGDFFLDWDHARFINHSFHNTEVFTTYEFGLAVRDVRISSHEWW